MIPARNGGMHPLSRKARAGGEGVGPEKLHINIEAATYTCARSELKACGGYDRQRKKNNAIFPESYLFKHVEESS